MQRVAGVADTHELSACRSELGRRRPGEPVGVTEARLSAKGLVNLRSGRARAHVQHGASGLGGHFLCPYQASLVERRYRL